MRRLAALFTAFLISVLSGCSSYQLGNPSELPYRTVSVSAPKNSTELAQIEAPLNAALRNEILQSEALSLADSGSADAELELTILEVKRDIAGVMSDDVGRGRKFSLIVTVSLSLRDASQLDAYFIKGRQFEISQDVYNDSGLVNAEYQATPELSDKIATRSIEIIQDLW